MRKLVYGDEQTRFKLKTQLVCWQIADLMFLVEILRPKLLGLESVLDLSLTPSMHPLTQTN